MTIRCTTRLILGSLVSALSLLGQATRVTEFHPDVGRGPEPGFTRDRGVRRTIRVRPDLSGFNAAVAERLANPSSPGERMLLRLLPEVELGVTWRQATTAAGGAGLAWTGKVEGTDGDAVMVIDGAMVAGNLSGGDGVMYQIRTTEAGETWIREVDRRAFPDETPGHDGKEPPPANPSEAALQDGRLPAGTAFADDGSVVDVMVLWTPAARQRAGGAAAMQQLVALGIAETNQGYRNSGIVHQVRLVYSAEVNYVESATMDTDLDRLTGTTDGYLDDIHRSRDAYGADLVSLWTEASDSCGIGWLLTNPNQARPERGFSVVARNCATGNYSFGHEMGHNMGATHAREDTQGSGAYPYAYGYKATGRFRTVMAYQGSCNCPRVNYWSSPEVRYQNMPTGVAPGQADAAYNALVLNNTRVTIANYRSAVAGSGASGLPESPHPYTNGLDRTWTYTAEGNPASINVTFDPRTSVESGADYIYIGNDSGTQVSGSPFTGATLSGRTVTVPGSTVRIRLVSDSNVNDYGFKVVSVTSNAGGGSGSLPTLAATAFAAPATAVTGTRNVAVRATISNTGSAAAGKFRVGFYLSRDTTVTTADIFTTYSCAFDSGLAAGATTTCSGDIGLPTSVAPGIWYLGVIADDRNEVQQGDRNRNARVSDNGATTVGTAAAEITSPLPGSILGSTAVTFQWTSGFGVTGYSLLVGTQQGRGDIFDRDMGSARTATVEGLPSNGSTVYVRLTSKTATGSSYLDYTYRAPSTASTPRLVVTTFSVPSTGSIGANLTGMSLTVRNTGTVDAGSFRIGFYFGRTATVRTTDTYSGWYCIIESLAAGASTTCGGEVGVPSSVSAGVWYVAAIADDQNRLVMTDRSGATRTSDNGPVQIEGLGAAELTSPAADSTFTSGTVTFRWTAGSAGAAQYYLRVGSSAGASDLYDQSQALNRSVTVEGLPTDGRGIFVRMQTRFGDTWYTKEYRFRAATVAASVAPQLVVTVFTAPTTGLAGKTLSDTRMTVKNAGNGNAGAFRVGYYWGRSSNVTTNDTFSGWYCTLEKGLVAGAEYTCTGEIGIPETLEAGTWYLAAIADDQRVVAQPGTAGGTRVSQNGSIEISAQAGTALPESPHPYANNESRVWTYSTAGANMLQVTFDSRTSTEDGYDFIAITDDNDVHVPGSPFTGNALAGKTVTITGSKVKIWLTSDDSVGDWGFKVTSIVDGTLPRLAVTTFTAPVTGAAGQRLAGTRMVVRNDGEGKAGPFRVQYYFGRSRTVAASDIDTGWGCDVKNGLAPGASLTCTGEIGVPGTLSPGTWYLAAIADDQQKIVQSSREGTVRVNENGPTVISAGDELPSTTPGVMEGVNQEVEPAPSDGARGYRSRPGKLKPIW